MRQEGSRSHHATNYLRYQQEVLKAVQGDLICPDARIGPSVHGLKATVLVQKQVLHTALLQTEVQNYGEAESAGLADFAAAVELWVATIDVEFWEAAMVATIRALAPW